MSFKWQARTKNLSFCEDRLIMFVLDLHFAGTDTMSNTLLTGFLYLMTYPCVQGTLHVLWLLSINFSLLFPIFFIMFDVFTSLFFSPSVSVCLSVRAMSAGDRPGVGKEGSCLLWWQTQHALRAGIQVWDMALCGIFSRVWHKTIT